jgi:two-component system response regulator HydG
MNKKANILIVDDEEVVRLSHLRSLARAGYRAEAVRNGMEAVYVLERRPIDLVFLDLRMPEMDGITLLRAIKQDWPDCEVVVITGYPSIDTAKEAVKLGAYNYLVKPVAPGDFVKLADDALTHKAWALKADGPSNTTVSNLQKRPWLDEFSARNFQTLYPKQGEM